MWYALATVLLIAFIVCAVIQFFLIGKSRRSWFFWDTLGDLIMMIFTWFLMFFE